MNEILKYKVEMDEYKSSLKLDNNIYSNSKDLKNALKAIAIVKGDVDFMKIDSELDDLVKTPEKLNKIFNVFANILSNFDKESKEYNGILSIMCAIEYQLNNI